MKKEEQKEVNAIVINVYNSLFNDELGKLPYVTDVVNNYLWKKLRCCNAGVCETKKLLCTSLI